MLVQGDYMPVRVKRLFVFGAVMGWHRRKVLP